MIKIEGNKGKLDSLYFGRFFIKEHLESGNYKLTNALGEELKQSFPIAKLRPFVDYIDKPKESHEIEKIVSDRINPLSKANEYLVKWKNLGNDHNQWLPAELFDDMRTIIIIYIQQNILISSCR